MDDAATLARRLVADFGTPPEIRCVAQAYLDALGMLAEQAALREQVREMQARSKALDEKIADVANTVLDAEREIRANLAEEIRKLRTEVDRLTEEAKQAKEANEAKEPCSPIYGPVDVNENGNGNKKGDGNGDRDNDR